MNEKTGLLTMDAHNYNYGGLLQAYALQHVIESLGYECEIIDYNQNSELRMFSPKRGIQYLSIKECRNKLSCFLHKEEKNPQIESLIQKRKEKFEKFRREYMKFSKPCNYGELSGIVAEYKTMVCGSDQIWNPLFAKPSFFLDFVPESVGKVIYAASIGTDTLTAAQEKVYKNYIRNLNWISVREAGAKRLIEQIAGDKPVQLVLDPTLLLESAHWCQLAGEKRLIEEQYLFCYFLESDVKKKEAVEKFALGRGLKPVFVSDLFDRFGMQEQNLFKGETAIGPLEFLNLIYHADFVLTDSFHGSVFSILFCKEFRVFGRNWNNGEMNTRIHTLLNYINQSDYLISPLQLGNDIGEQKMEWNYNEIINKRESSKQWLSRALLAPIC